MIQRFRWVLLVISILSISSTHAMEEVAQLKNQDVSKICYLDNKLLAATPFRDQRGKQTTLTLFEDETQRELITIPGRVTSLAPLTKTCFMYTTKDGYWGWYNCKTGKKSHKPARAHSRRDKLLLGGSFLAGTTNSINNYGSEKSPSEKREKVTMFLSKSGILELLTSSTGKVKHREIEFGKGKLIKAVLHKKAQRIAFVPKKSTRGYVYALDNGSTTPLPQHERKVLTINFSHDGKTICTAGKDGVVHVSDVATGKKLQSIAVLEHANDNEHTEHSLFALFAEIVLGEQNSNKIHSVGTSPCGRLLATVDADNSVKIWDAQTTTLIKNYQLPDSVHSCSHHGTLQCLFKPDNSTLLVYNKANRVAIDLAKVRAKRVILSEEERAAALKTAMANKKRKTAFGYNFYRGIGN